MASANVIISFEAESSDEVREKVAAWTLHEGCSVSVSIMESTPLHTTDESGSVVPIPEPDLPPPQSEEIKEARKEASAGPPPKSASRSDWNSYATLFGLDPNLYKTKNELIEAVEARRKELS